MLPPTLPSRRGHHAWPWLAAAAIAVAAAPAGAAPATQALTIYSNPEDRVSIEAIGWLGLSEVCPAVGTGLIPLEFRVVNGSPRDVVVTIGGRDNRWMGNGTVMPRTSLRVPGGETTSRMVFFETLAWSDYGGSQIPAVMLNAQGAGPRLDVDVGVMLRQTTVTEFVPGGVPAGPLAPPPTQAPTAPRVYSAAALGLLRPSTDGAWPAPGGIPEAEIDLAAAPDDWRGFTMLREMVIADDDWTTMPSGTRRALLAWVGLGGLLRVVAADDDGARIDRLGLPPAGADGRRRVGAGEVMVVPPGEATWGALHGQGGPAADATPPLERPGNPMGSFGYAERGLPFVPILAFLAVFAILAGPANVMVLAGKGRPARIFWTTPALAVAATTVLLALMLLRDGVGGDGRRLTVALLDPDHSQAHVLQQQLSRTGVLVGRSFPIRETSWMHPETTTVQSPAQRGMANRGADFREVEGTRRTGDWFRSRSDQAFTLQAVRSSRGRLAVAGPPEAPEIVSSIDVPLSRVLVVDAEGRPWRCDALGAGERRPLAPATEADVDSLRRELLTSAGPRIRMAVERLCGAPGIAWAQAAEPAGVAIATLDAIRWTDDRAWFVSPIGAGEAP